MFHSVNFLSCNCRYDELLLAYDTMCNTSVVSPLHPRLPLNQDICIWMCIDSLNKEDKLNMVVVHVVSFLLLLLNFQPVPTKVSGPFPLKV